MRAYSYNYQGVSWQVSLADGGGATFIYIYDLRGNRTDDISRTVIATLSPFLRYFRTTIYSRVVVNE